MGLEDFEGMQQHAFLFFDIQIQLFKLMYSVRKLDLILTYWLKLRVIIFLARSYVNIARNDA